MWCDAHRQGIGGAIGSNLGRVVNCVSCSLSTKRQDAVAGSREDVTKGCTRDVVVSIEEKPLQCAEDV